MVFRIPIPDIRIVGGVFVGVKVAEWMDVGVSVSVMATILVISRTIVGGRV
ncbi:MAG: hypothetical protein JW793_15980 [Acidobacteria bacterium]|nr:hypothetical protein [Acidobacteriota bacterium]